MKPAQGRPKGFLAAWLQTGCEIDDAWHHTHCLNLIFASRDLVRRQLETGCDDPAQLAAIEERPARDGEGLEPVEGP